jgi:hypothetical protein
VGWHCYRCGRLFIHARILVTHLIEFHGEKVGSR